MVSRFVRSLSILVAICFVDGARGGSSDLPVLKVRGNHFQIGLQTVRIDRSVVVKSVVQRILDEA